MESELTAVLKLHHTRNVLDERGLSRDHGEAAAVMFVRADLRITVRALLGGHNAVRRVQLQVKLWE